MPTHALSSAAGGWQNHAASAEWATLEAVPSFSHHAAFNRMRVGYGPDGYGNDAAEQCIDGICSNVLRF